MAPSVNRQRLMEVEIDPTFRKRLRAKTLTRISAITRCVEKLVENPRHPGLRTSKMGGTDDVWEARASRGDRVTFRFGPGRIILLNHCNHDLVR